MSDFPENDDGQRHDAGAVAGSEVTPDQKTDVQAAADAEPVAATEVKALKVKSPAPAKLRKAAPRKPAATAMPGVTKPAARKAVKKTTAVKAAPMKIASTGPARKGIGPAPRTAPLPSISELKEKIMTMTTPDYTENMTDAVAEMQTRSKEAYEKGTAMMSEMSDFTKGTVEAMVESGKIFSGAMQDMGKSYVDEAKAAYEQLTTDLKDMAAVKSPTELLQLQGKIMRRNFDAMVANSSKNAEKIMKISNDAFAPLSARISLATEKMSNAA